MNSSTKELLHRLELATSREPTDEMVSDDETALLREQWDYLGRLLTAAHGVEGEENTPGRIVVASISEWSTTADLPSKAEPVKLARQWWVLAGLSAVAVLCAWLAVGENMSGSVDNGQQDVATTRPLATESSSPTASGRDVSELPADSRELAWEDDWDANLARSSLAVQQIRSPLKRDATWTRLQDTLQELAQEVESGSL